MEKTFALKSAIPTLATNGRLAIYPTLDRNVSMILILKEGFEWENRKKEEVWRCGRCGTYIFPTDKSKVRNGLKYHQICTFKKEIINEVDNARTGADTSVNMARMVDDGRSIRSAHPCGMDGETVYPHDEGGIT